MIHGYIVVNAAYVGDMQGALVRGDAQYLETEQATAAAVRIVQMHSDVKVYKVSELMHFKAKAR